MVFRSRHVWRFGWVAFAWPVRTARCVRADGRMHGAKSAGKCVWESQEIPETAENKRKSPLRWNECSGLRGADGSRNRDLFDANEALYQLSYSPLDVALLRRTTQYTLIRPMSKCKPACVKIGCRLWADMRHCAWGASLGEPSPSDATERNQAGRAANRSGRSR